MPGIREWDMGPDYYIKRAADEVKPVEMHVNGVRGLWRPIADPPEDEQLRVWRLEREQRVENMLQRQRNNGYTDGELLDVLGGQPVVIRSNQDDSLGQWL